MIALICFYILLIALTVVYYRYNREQITREVLIALTIKIIAITIMYFLFFGPSHKVKIDNAKLNNMLKRE